MFDGLSKKLTDIISKLTKRGVLTEESIDSTVREIRISLLEADVALSVVKIFIANIKEKLHNQKTIANLNSEQTIVQIVFDELVSVLGKVEIDNKPIEKRNGAVLLAGLQGTGKTTTAAKLAFLLKNKWQRKVLLVSTDTARPAAIEQLKKLADKNKIDFFSNINLSTDTPISIAKRASILQEEYEVIIYDTAGRLSIDNSLMQEIVEIKGIVQPRETTLVIDSMMGQDAVNTAKIFHEKLNITNIILTKIDGDSKGGAALSVKSVTNCPIKYICNGESITDIEEFHPDRIASRILDKGDALTLIEKAMEKNIQDEIKDIDVGKNFDLSSMIVYLRQMEKIGGMGGILKFLPNARKIKEKLKEANINDKTIARQIAIVQSMTLPERQNPKILNASRKKRIAKGSGQQVSEINSLLKQFEQIKLMMTKLNNPSMMEKLLQKLK